NRKQDLASGLVTALISPRGTVAVVGRVLGDAFHRTNATEVTLLDVPTTKQRATWRIRARIEGAPAMRFSPDGALLATWDRDGPIDLWDPATGARQRVLAIDQKIQHLRILESSTGPARRPARDILLG